jgi:MFS family permease
MWGASAAIGAAIGPLVGGLFEQVVGWGGVFWFSAALMLLCIPMVLRRVPESTGEQSSAGLDWLGVGLIAGAMSSLIVYATYGADFGWLSATGIFVLVLTIGSVVGFVVRERRCANPLVDLSLFSIAPFTGATAALVVFNTGLTAFILGFQLYLQNPFGFDMTALQAGAALLPVTCIVLIFSFLVSRISHRLGMRRTIVVGFVALGLGYLALAPIDPGWGWLAFTPAILLIGIGGALANGPITAVATAVVPKERAGAASGVNNMARYLGGAIAAPLATGLYTGVATSDVEQQLADGGAKDPAGSAEKLVGASSSDSLDALQQLPASTSDAVRDATSAALSSGMFTLLVTLAAITSLGVMLAIFVGRRTVSERDAKFDDAALPAAISHTVPRTPEHGAPSS